MAGPVPEGSTFLKLVLSLVCLGAFGGGCTAGYFAYHAVVEAKQSLDWPKATGTITRSEVDVTVTKDRDHDRDRNRHHEETRSYSAAIEYEFTVDGTVYTGTRIMVISDQFGSKDWARATAARFPRGGNVAVSYDPANPKRCVLEPGRWGGAAYLMIIAGVFGLFPPLVLKAIWSTKPVKTGWHPETRDQRILRGLEIRERVLEWEPGKLVHLQRDSISLLSVIGGAAIAGLVLGLLFGLVPAMFFFSGQGPVFLGKAYLGASLVAAIVCAVWLWLDNRPRETRIEWSSQLIHLAVGSSSTDVGFSDIQELTVTAPEPKRSSNSDQQPRNIAVRINLLTGGRTYILAEAECPETALRHIRSKMTSTARQLAESMNVTLRD
ncbi:MAG: DUF3592 domain-containing protein [Planctomycetaceae bacterium]